MKVEVGPELRNFERPKYEQAVCVCERERERGKGGGGLAAEVAEGSLFQVPEVPTNLYEYLIPPNFSSNIKTNFWNGLELLLSPCEQS